MVIAFLCGSLHDATICIWRLRFGRIQRSKFREQSLFFLTLSGILCLIPFVLALESSLFLIQTATPPDSYFSPIYWKPTLFVANMCHAFMVFHRIFIFLEVSIMLTDVAKTVKSNDLDRCNSIELETICRNMKRVCVKVSLDLGLPLALLHSNFFLLFTLEFPIMASRAVCNDPRELSIYSICLHMVSFLEFLTVVNAGDAIDEKCKRLTRKVRKQIEFLHESVGELQLFARSDHGITFGLRNGLNYKSCCCFLSLSLGFTLAVFQTNFYNGQIQCLFEPQQTIGTRLR